MGKPEVPDINEIVNKRSFIHDALLLMGNRFFVMLITFGIGVVLARALGADGRGVYTAVLVYPLMFLSLTEMGVRQSAIYYLGKQIFTSRQVVGAVSTLILFSSLIGMVFCGIIMLTRGNITFSPTVIILAVSMIPFTLVTQYSAGIFLGKQLIQQFAFIQRMSKLLQLVLIVTIVWWLATDVPGALLALLLSSILAAGCAMWYVRKISPLRPSFDWLVIQPLLTKGSAFAISTFIMILNYRIDIILMQRLSTASEIGIYTIAVGIAELTWTLPQSVTTALFSHSANAYDEQAFGYKVARLFRVGVLVSLLVVICLAVASPFLIPIIYGKEYIASVRVMQLLLPGVFFLLLLKLLSMDLAGRGRPLLTLWVKIPALVVNILLNIYLLPRHGAQGAAISSSVSYFLTGFGFMLIYCWFTKLPIVELLHYQRSDFNFIERLLPPFLKPKVR